MTFWQYAQENPFVTLVLGLAWAAAFGSFGPLILVKRSEKKDG